MAGTSLTLILQCWQRDKSNCVVLTGRVRDKQEQFHLPGCSRGLFPPGHPCTTPKGGDALNCSMLCRFYSRFLYKMLISSSLSMLLWHILPTCTLEHSSSTLNNIYVQNKRVLYSTEMGLGLFFLFTEQINSPLVTVGKLNHSWARAEVSREQEGSGSQSPLLFQDSKALARPCLWCVQLSRCQHGT